MSVNPSTFGALGQSFLDSTFSGFKKSIKIQEFKSIPDQQGGYIDGWETITATVNGEVILMDDVDCFCLPQSGKEMVVNGKLENHQGVKFHLAPIDGLSEDMKIVLDNVDYQIRSIKNLADADQWLVIDGEKGVAQ